MSNTTVGDLLEAVTKQRAEEQIIQGNGFTALSPQKGGRASKVFTKGEKTEDYSASRKFIAEEFVWTTFDGFVKSLDEVRNDGSAFIVRGKLLSSANPEKVYRLLEGNDKIYDDGEVGVGCFKP